MLRRGYPLRLPVIAALRPIRAWNHLFSEAFICNRSHREEGHDDNTEDKHPKPAPQVDRRFGIIRFMVRIRCHGVGFNQSDRLFQVVMA